MYIKRSLFFTFYNSCNINECCRYLPLEVYWESICTYSLIKWKCCITCNVLSNTNWKLSLAQSNDNTHSPTSFISLTNISDYQTAQALATEAKTIFNNRLTTKVNPNMASATTILQLGEGLDLLSTSINNKTSYEDVMTIIHGRIHPLLIRAYDLM